MPDDIHRAAALVAHVFCFTEIDEGRSTGLVFVVFSDKEENLEAYFLMVDVALPRIGCFGCGALALPVEEMLIDGVVGVHGRRGIVFVGFVQCIDEKVEVSVFQVENALTHGFRFFWMAECDENLVLGVVAMEIERAGEAKIDVFIDEIEVIEVVLQDIADFLAHDRIFSDRGHVTCQVAVIVWIFRAVRRPDGVLEHLEHETSFFFCCIADGARHEFRKDGLDPSPGVDGTDFTHCFGNGLLERFFEVFPLVRLHAEAVEAGGIGPLRFSIGVEVLDVHAVVGKEIVQGKRSSAVFFKGADSLDELALCAKRCIDISKDVFGCFFLEMDIAAARDGDETSLDLIRQTSVSFIQKGSEFRFKVVFLIGLSDKIEDGEAFFPFRETQSASELLEENGQGFGWPQEKDGVDGFDVDAFVVKVDDEDEFHLTGDEFLLGGFPVCIGRIARQVHGWHVMVIEIVRHELRMGFGNAEPKSGNVVPVGHVTIRFLEDPFSSFLRAVLFHGVDVGKLGSIVASPRPPDLAEVSRVVDAEILEGTEELPVDGIGQADFHGDTSVKVRQDALSIHSLRCRGHAKKDLRLVVAEE